MVGSNIVRRKQLEKMTIEHLIDFAMKLPRQPDSKADRINK